LDSKEKIASLDRQHMLEALANMPEHFSEGLRKGRMSALPRFAPKSIVVCGVGGSAIGGDILCRWLGQASDIPCGVVRSYSVPPSVGRDSLVIVASYSGNTEETISMFESAKRRGAKIVIASSGGTLAQLGERHGLPFVKLPSGMKPRASLGSMVGAMLGVLERSGVRVNDKELEEAVRVLAKVVSESNPSVPTVDNASKRMAHELFGKVPVVVGYGLSAPVAKRWSDQLNENSKSMAFSSELPELDHNGIVGWALDERSQGFAAVFLDHRTADGPMKRRVKATKDMISRRAQVMAAESLGISPLAQMMSLVLFGDYVSVYLGMLRGFDPSSNEPIDELKAVLSKK